MKIAIIGAGAMGCLYACILEKAGEVTLYDVFAPAVEAINEHGIVKKEPDGSLWLIPNNPAYDTKHYSHEEIRTMPVSIIGKVVELRGKF